MGAIVVVGLSLPTLGGQARNVVGSVIHTDLARATIPRRECVYLRLRDLLQWSTLPVFSGLRCKFFPLLFLPNRIAEARSARDVLLSSEPLCMQHRPLQRSSLWAPDGIGIGSRRANSARPPPHPWAWGGEPEDLG